MSQALVHRCPTQEDKARLDIRCIDDAARSFFARHARVPELADLVVPDSQGRSWLEGFEAVDQVKESWDRPYVLRPISARSWVVVCAGPDQLLGTTDDIVLTGTSR